MGGAYIVEEDIKTVVCPYCGYNLPLKYDDTTNVNGLYVRCKGKHCKMNFMLIIKNGVQKNTVPDQQTIEAFKQVFGAEYAEHLQESFGVII